MRVEEASQVQLTLLLMAAASLVVATTLVVFQNVWLTFAMYHLGICLGLPLLDSLLLRRETVRAHIRRLGLSGLRLKSGIGVGLLCGAVMGGGTWVAFALLGDLFLAHNRIAPLLARWGVTPDRAAAMFVFMVLGNGIAEELFWRGYIHRRLDGVARRRGAVGLAAAFYASYHAVTIALLFHDAVVTALFMLAVFAAGCIWGWLREKYGNVWPALLGHVGATVGYMLVYWLRIAGRSG
jgi:membrane protease YdiL (CAAX protease family)